VSSLLLSWILSNEQLGMRPYQVGEGLWVVVLCVLLLPAFSSTRPPTRPRGVVLCMPLLPAFSTRPRPAGFPPPLPPTPSTQTPLTHTHTQNAIEASLNYDKCLALRGDDRLSCQLDKALTNVGALLAGQVEGRVCTEIDPRLAHDKGGFERVGAQWRAAAAAAAQAIAPAAHSRTTTHHSPLTTTTTPTPNRRHRGARALPAGPVP
jgi:hypothetical protein